MENCSLNTEEPTLKIMRSQLAEGLGTDCPVMSFKNMNGSQIVTAKD